MALYAIFNPLNHYQNEDKYKEAVLCRKKDRKAYKKPNGGQAKRG